MAQQQELHDAWADTFAGYREFAKKHPDIDFGEYVGFYAPQGVVARISEPCSA